MAKRRHIQMFSIHGLIRGRQLELGRDADTGGQSKYVVELARALGDHPEVARVDLFTRLVEDERISPDYAKPVEALSERARIVRLRCGPKRYLRKELLWPHLDEFVDNVLRFNREEGATPDLVHGHYADAGYVAKELASLLGVPLVFTGHSLGRNKLRALTHAGHGEDEIDKQYRIRHRIAVEEDVLGKADTVIASTTHEVERGYELYDTHKRARYQVIPPGIDVAKFYPYYYDLDEGFDPGEEIVRARVRMKQEIARFLREPDKPLILAVSRPDRRKNIDGLVTAYGEDKELQMMANLAIFAGVRKDISEMSDNERDVLTQLLLLMDKYDLYGKLALPKKHDPDTDIPVLYRIAAAKRGAFINPALVENFGITLIEASSSGLPVVSTDHGGPQDIIANCESGILVDARDTSGIQQALKRILSDGDAWQRFSDNGVAGVRKHYAWSAHAERYLEVVGELVERPREKLIGASWRSDVGRRLGRYQALLISDIDHTLIGTEDDEEALCTLRERLDERGDIGFGVATGRSLELVKEVLGRHEFPPLDVVVSSVGSEIHYGPDLLPDRGYARYLSHRWEPDAVREALNHFPFLEQQKPQAQRPYKLSYFLEDASKLGEVKAALADAKLKCSVIYSHGRFLDILPYRASKGKAIRYLADKWGLKPDKIAVAGDSGNDEEMLAGRFKGIVVGNHQPELKPLKKRRNVYFAQAAYARGVLEGLEHHGLL